MRESDSRVLRKMDSRCSIFKLLLFQMCVVWCGAKHIEIDDMLRVEFPTAELESQVQSSIRNLVHNGIYSHKHLDTSQASIATPVKVTFDGQLVSRAVEHDHEHGHARARRDLHMREHELPHTLHYNLTVDGRELRLDLRPSATFITPAMMVEKHTAEGRSRHKPHAQATACHYTGVVRGQPGSSVALSACDGLAGLLRTQHGEFWIEPSDQIPNNSSEGRSHLIFKRSAVDKVAAWHRAKRSVDNTNHYNLARKNPNDRAHKYLRPSSTRRNTENKQVTEKQRREYLESRRRQLEEWRKNSPAYKKALLKKAQRDKKKQQQRQNSSMTQSNSSTHSNSATNSVESRSFEVNNRNRTRPRLTKAERIQKRLEKRRRKRCGTKQPPYQWKNQNRDKKKRRRPHHHQLSHRPEFAPPRRSARSVSVPRHVEVLLVADKSMTKFHKDEGKLQQYLLTIMNMVSSLYMDPSIGNYIKIVVVKIILIEEVSDAPSLDVSTDADITLHNFCRWQQKLNPADDSNPHHHDVAILITRTDICSLHDIPCSTLGVAHVAGMCKPDRSCSVNEDNGIMLAHTITHELGHNFGLYHDTEKIGCHRREGDTLHIMTPIFEADTVQVAWSRCSKRDVTNFLDTGSGECLGDTPSQKDYEYPEVPAGVMFTAETQCHLQFGADATVCTDPAELCQHLWCQVNNTCKTMLRPAAAGTSCGQGMWCKNQECVPRSPKPEPRDGGWGEWSEWSECSRTCGAGVSTRSRECNNPDPINNGKYCIGERSRYKICNTEPCPLNEPSFRDVQCSKYGRNSTIAEWVPYFDQDKPCELMCVPRDGNGNGNDMEFGGFVADGTSCRQSVGARDMCIAGVCHKVGCDWVVDSEAEEDACGVCGGNGTACKTVQGIYNKGTTKQSGFSEVAVIPAGSRNVKIKEKVNPGNYISIGSAKTNKFYINGGRNESLTEYFVAGSSAVYERDRDWEKVRIPGPIAEDLRIYQHIYRGKNRNPVVTYKYTVDRQSTSRRRNFSYRLSEWSACSASCGNGYRRRHLQCVDEHGHLVEQAQCYFIESPRSDVLMERCQTTACEDPLTTYWWYGSWEACSKRCRMPGEEPTKSRNVYCVDKNKNTIINSVLCDSATKPAVSMRCADVPPC